MAIGKPFGNIRELEIGLYLFIYFYQIQFLVDRDFNVKIEDNKEINKHKLGKEIIWVYIELVICLNIFK